MNHSRPSRLQGLEPSRVCIIKPSSLGDVVHALPILAALRDRWPSAYLAWVVNRPFEGLLRGHTDLDELIVYDRAGTGVDRLGLGAAGGVYQRLFRSGFDLTIDLQGLLRSALMTAATQAKIRVGVADAREGARWFYTDLVEAPRLGLHAVERVKRVARALGADASRPRFNLPIRESDRRWARDIVAGVRSPKVVLNLGARWETKRWPPAHFAAIGRRAAQELGAGLIAVGSSADRPLVDRLVHHLGPVPVLDLCGRTGLIELAALAAETDLLLSNDTGPLHLAAAAGARVVGIYTCTSPQLTGPFGPRVATVQSCVWCAPSFIKKCHRLDCMSELDARPGLADRKVPDPAGQRGLKSELSIWPWGAHFTLNLACTTAECQAGKPDLLRCQAGKPDLRYSNRPDAVSNASGCWVHADSVWVDSTETSSIWLEITSVVTNWPISSSAASSGNSLLTSSGPGMPIGGVAGGRRRSRRWPTSKRSPM